MRVVDGELEWFAELELALEFRGDWTVAVRQPPPFPVLCAECKDAPLSLEVYALDPDNFRTGEAVGVDLLQSRLDPLDSESYQPSGKGWEVHGVGVEVDLPTEIRAYVVYDNDVWYVLAFSGWSGTLDDELWRIHAITRSAQFGKHPSHGTGVDGLMKLVSHHLADAGVQFGRTRGHLGFTRAQSTIRRGRPAGWTDEQPPIPETDEEPIPPTLSVEAAPLEVDGELLDDPLADGLAEELLAFDQKLRDRTGERLPTPEPKWPRPWQALPNVQARPADPDPRSLEAVRAPRGGRASREQEIRAMIDALPAEVAVYAEKIHGVPSSFGHRELLAYSVTGLDRLPVAMEAGLRLRQSELTSGQVLAVGSPRRAPSRLGREVPDGAGVTVDEALIAMFREDDWTAYDLLGWELGWKDVQSRLPAFGLTHHSVLVPARARVLAYCDLAGPLQGLDFSERVERWRGLDTGGRRALIGQVHKAQLELPLEELEAAWLEVAHRPDPDGSRGRWSLALGPRGCAMEYTQLIAALVRDEVLGMTWGERIRAAMKPCVGDQLSGAVAGVQMIGGKLGQTFGALNAAGWVAPIAGTEVAMCILARKIETNDHEALAEQLRLVAGLTYQVVLR